MLGHTMSFNKLKRKKGKKRERGKRKMEGRKEKRREGGREGCREEEGKETFTDHNRIRSEINHIIESYLESTLIFLESINILLDNLWTKEEII